MKWLSVKLYEWKYNKEEAPFVAQGGSFGVLYLVQCSKCGEQPEWLWECDVCSGYEREEGYLCLSCLEKIVVELGAKE